MRIISSDLFKNKRVKQACIMGTGCLVLALSTTRPVRAQLSTDDILLEEIIADLGTLNTDITAQGVPVTATATTDTTEAAFETTTVYPVTSIATAQSSAATATTQASSNQSLIDTTTASAQLATNQTLENTLLSRNASNAVNINAQYQATYGTLPAANQSTSTALNAVDMGDATAMEDMKKALELDALADKEMAAAQQLLTQLQSSAPGNAPIVSAQAAAWVLQAQAYTQSGLAQMMRSQGAELGYNGVGVKAASATAGAMPAALFGATGGN